MDARGDDAGDGAALRTRLRLGFLTTRGWILFVCGAVALVLAWLLGRRELVNIAVFLLAVPLLAAAAVGLGRTRLHVRRRFSPDPVVSGESTTVILELGHAGPVPAGTVLREALPEGFGDAPQFSAGGAGPAFRYRLRPTHRGVYAVGPLQARFTDPFGLATRRLAVDRPSPLTVVPPILQLPPTGVLGETGTSGTATTHHQATPENDDVMTREYRDGDSMRRVHWPATARHNALMVRQEEFQRTPQATIVVESRREPYNGSYVGFDAEAAIPNFTSPPGTTTGCFDWIIQAAIGIGAHLAGLGYDLDVLDEAGMPLAASAPGSRDAARGRFAGPQAAEDLQLSLAAVGLKPADPRHSSGSPADDAPGGAMALPAIREASHPLILFTGALDGAAADAWVRTVGLRRHVVVFLVTSRPAASRESTRVFRTAGWFPLAVDPTTELADAWRELATAQRVSAPWGSR